MEKIRVAIDVYIQKVIQIGNDIAHIFLRVIKKNQPVVIEDYERIYVPIKSGT